jgi:hypothetical protein
VLMTSLGFIYSYFSVEFLSIVRGESGGNFADSPKALADGINF